MNILVLYGQCMPRLRTNPSSHPTRIRFITIRVVLGRVLQPLTMVTTSHSTVCRLQRPLRLSHAHALSCACPLLTVHCN